MKAWTRYMQGRDRRERVELVVQVQDKVLAGAILLTGPNSPWDGSPRALFEREAEARAMLRQIARRTVAVVRGGAVVTGEPLLTMWAPGNQVPVLDLATVTLDLEKSLAEDGFLAAEVDE